MTFFVSLSTFVPHYQIVTLFPERYMTYDESYLPSLATSCENMASNSERIMEKSRNFQIVYVGHTNLTKQTN